jgi:hypothetical protein
MNKLVRLVQDMYNKGLELNFYSELLSIDISKSIVNSFADLYKNYPKLFIAEFDIVHQDNGSVIKFNILNKNGIEVDKSHHFDCDFYIPTANNKLDLENFYSIWNHYMCDSGYYTDMTINFADINICKIKTKDDSPFMILLLPINYKKIYDKLYKHQVEMLKITKSLLLSKKKDDDFIDYIHTAYYVSGDCVSDLMKLNGGYLFKTLPPLFKWYMMNNSKVSFSALNAFRPLDNQEMAIRETINEIILSNYMIIVPYIVKTCNNRKISLKEKERIMENLIYYNQLILIALYHAKITQGIMNEHQEYDFDVVTQGSESINRLNEYKLPVFYEANQDKFLQNLVKNKNYLRQAKSTLNAIKKRCKSDHYCVSKTIKSYINFMLNDDEEIVALRGNMGNHEFIKKNKNAIIILFYFLLLNVKLNDVVSFFDAIEDS